MKYLFLLLSALSLSNCTHYYYTPNTLNVPNLRERHDATISVGYYYGDTDVEGFELKSVYSPSKNIGLMLNHLHIKKATGEHAEDWGRGRLTELGFGGYWPVGLFSLSVFGGYGRGLSEHSFLSQNQMGAREPMLAKLAFEQWFVQPNITFQWDWFQLGIAAKRQRLRYTKGDIDHRLNPADLNPIRRIEQQRYFDVWQLGYSLTLNLRLVVLNIDASRVFSPDDWSSFRLNETGINLGMGFNIDEFF